ncbi:MAG: glycosyltransferase, partial [Bosea sp. (in: a-proteobacteria)]
MSEREQAGKRILIAALGTLGDVKPWLALAQALAKHGHTVRVASSAGFADMVRRAGLAFALIRPDVSLGDDALVQDCMIGTGATQNIHHLYVLPHIEAASLDIHALCAEADLLISNQIIIGASSIAAKAGIPWMMAIVSPMALEMTVFLPGHAALPWMIDSNAVLDPLKPIYVQARARLNRQLGLADD